MPKIDRLFPTTLYRDRIPARQVSELAAGCMAIAQEDKAGQRWSKANKYKGYTSYASLNDLPRRHPAFEDFRKILGKHVAAFARAAAFDLAGRKLVLDSMWINILEKNGVHAPHIHPHSVLSGTCYVQTPKGSGAIRFEDPRLGLMMAAPARRKTAALENRTFVSLAPRNGDLLLWESWLRHGVEMHEARQARISISFNYRLD